LIKICLILERHAANIMRDVGCQMTDVRLLFFLGGTRSFSLCMFCGKACPDIYSEG
jgi:hypothetical protein